MKVFLGADHRGFHLKEGLTSWLKGQGHEVTDVGATELRTDDDYVDYGLAVATQIADQTSRLSLGIVICGSGVGICVTANKVKGIRCGLGLTVDQVKAARQDDNIQVLALAADFISEAQAREMVEIFLTTEFSGHDRHVRRLEKIAEIE